MLRKALFSSAILAAVGLVSAANGLASGTVVTVSSEPSPMAACPNGAQTGQNYVSGEVEPQT
jgi:hypothetical protein